MKRSLYTHLLHALNALKPSLGQCATVDQADWDATLEKALRIEQPRHREHGDYAVNVSFLAKHARLAPPAIAEAVQNALALDGMTSSLAGGFINFKANDATLTQTLLPTASGKLPAGQNESLSEERLHLEFVSANPTGPLHIGHGRWAALGDSLQRIWKHNGARVVTEFYVNDYGSQMTNMANSVWFRALEVLGLAEWPTPVEGEKFPYYPGEYVIDLANTYLKDAAHKALIESTFAANGAVRLETLADHGLLDTLRLLSRDTMLALQKELLERFRCPFDVWQLESTLHESNAVPKTLEHLKRSGHTFEEGGALWLKSSEMGDDKDRVLVKQDGSLTYLTADVAYHDAKYKRPENFTKLVNIWGADHHGYIPRIKASMMALGHDASKLEIILGQLVSLIVSGERTRMGKRKTMQQLDEIMDDVGVDATRFWLVSRSADSTIEFDVDLAGSASQDNPVFYTQYAHARASGILRNAFSPTLNTETGEESPARFTQEQFYAYKSSVVSEDWANFLLTSIKDDPAYSKVRETLLLLISFAERVEDAGRVSSPHVIARYALELAGDFHSLYAGCRVLCDDDDQAMARLLLVDALRTTLAQSLDLLGVTAPESM